MTKRSVKIAALSVLCMWLYNGPFTGALAMQLPLNGAFAKGLLYFGISYQRELGLGFVVLALGVGAVALGYACFHSHKKSD